MGSSHAAGTMVVKSETCSFSGNKIFPGHGIRYIRTDGRMFLFINGKSEASLLMKRNPRKISWTQFYRRLHKKGQTEETAKKRAARKVKVQRAYVGASLDVIKAKAQQKAANAKKKEERKKAASKSGGSAKQQAPPKVV